MEFSAPFMSHMLTWDYSNRNIMELRFEDLIANDFSYFARVLSFLGLLPQRITIPQISAATAKYSFANLSHGRTRGQEDSWSHYRKGQPGDWRNHFDSSHIDYFKKLYNPVLLKLGYENNEDWNNTRPSALMCGAEINAHGEGLRLFQSEKYEEAARLFHKALLERENAELWNDWATAEWFCGRAEQAEMGYRRAIRLEPDHSQAALNLCVVMANSTLTKRIGGQCRILSSLDSK
jgi:tetratricopeptide (TPR) repeat protein